MNTYLERVTECEHGFDGPVHAGPGGYFYIPTNCPGGSRELATGQQIQWCEVHDAQEDRTDHGNCDWADGHKPCRIVAARLTKEGS